MLLREIFSPGWSTTQYSSYSRWEFNILSVKYNYYPSETAIKILFSMSNKDSHIKAFDEQQLWNLRRQNTWKSTN